ncbi:Aminodeoxychorismate lyase [Pleosporales sp. CAS-2024a]
MAATEDFQLFTSVRYDALLLESDENSRSDLNFITPSPLYMLAYHRSRMLEAAQHFAFDAVAQRLQDGPALHNDILQRVHDWQSKHTHEKGPLKLRVLFDKCASMTVECVSIPPVPLSTLFPSSLDPPNPKPRPPHPANTFTPSPLAGGALALGPTDSLPTSTLPMIPPPPEWALKLDTQPTPSSPFTLLKTTMREMYNAARARALPDKASGPAPAYREVMLYNEVQELTEGTLSSLYLYRGGRWVTPPVGVPSAFKASGEDGEDGDDEGELREPFAGRWGHSVRSKKVGAGGQRGTSRRWALGKGFCMEEPVGVETVERRTLSRNGSRPLNTQQAQLLRIALASLRISISAYNKVKPSRLLAPLAVSAIALFTTATHALPPPPPPPPQPGVKPPGPYMPATNLNNLAKLMPISALPVPNSQLQLKYVVLGLGTQNYTCTTGNPSVAPGTTGAYASLYDIGTKLNHDPMAAYKIASITPLALAFSNYPTILEWSLKCQGYEHLVGHHLFKVVSGTNTPTFAFDQLALTPYPQAQVSKLNETAAPAGASTGLTGEGAVKWLYLHDTKGLSQGGIDTVYRLETAGGASPTTCQGMPAEFEVKYAAQYWVFGPRS